MTSEIPGETLGRHIGETIYELGVMYSDLRYFTDIRGALDAANEAVAAMYAHIRYECGDRPFVARVLLDHLREHPDHQRSVQVLKFTVTPEIAEGWEPSDAAEDGTVVFCDDEISVLEELVGDEEYNDDRIPGEVTATKRIGVSGNSLTLNLTEELRMLELDYGDLVQVTVRHIEK